MLAGSRHSAPVLVRGDDYPLQPLRRLELGRGIEDGRRREAFIQDLVHDHPEIVPMADIEPAFMPLVPVCRELETEAGSVDNLWLTPAGGIVIGQCKLVRNPQARREVLMQVLDYARAISTWHYENLEAQIRKALKDPRLTLWEFVKEESDLDEAQFADAVERRLNGSRFMVLIIGDGIQEGVEALTDYLQLHAGLHVGVALVDLSIWQGPDEALLVVPRIPLRTVLVERGIVVVGDQGRARIEPPMIRGLRSTSAAPRATTASEPEFYQQLDERRPGLAVALRSFLASLEGLGVTAEFRRSLNLRWRVSPEIIGTLSYIDVDGRVWLNGAWGTAHRLGNTMAGERYLQTVADIVGGTVRHYDKSWPDVVDAIGRAVEAAPLLTTASERWRDAMVRLMAEFQDAGA